MSLFLMSPYNCSTPQLSCGQIMFRAVPITVSTLRDNRISNSHWHDYLQIWYTSSGEYLHTVNGVTHNQSSGSVMLIFPYMIHKIDASASVLKNTLVYEISIRKNMLEKYNIPFLSHSYCSASFASLYLKPSVTVSDKDKEAVDIICSELLTEYNKRSAMQTTKMFNAIARLLEICAKNADRTASLREISSTRARLECIDEAMTYLINNSSSKITLDNVSNAAMMSRSAFARGFNETVGQTCHNYLNSLRMSCAVGMLRKTRKSISEIAEECGFSDAGHLARACGKFFGDSPLTIRKKYSKWAREYGDSLFRRHMSERSWTLQYDDELLEKHWCEMSFY